MKSTRLGTGYSDKQHDLAKNILERVGEHQTKRMGRSSQIERNAVEGVHGTTEEKRTVRTYFMTSKIGQLGKGHLLKERRTLLVDMSKYPMGYYQIQACRGVTHRLPRGPCTQGPASPLGRRVSSGKPGTGVMRCGQRK